MMSNPDAQARYINVLQAGPFVGRVDPWAETGHFFQQIHKVMIGAMAIRLQKPLLERGYYTSQEASLQISNGGQPDIAVLMRSPKTDAPVLDYNAMAAQLFVTPGVALEPEDTELDALYVYSRKTGDLVTIVEVISPSNKAERSDILLYIQRRERFVYERTVNVVEIDLTRSHMHLVSDTIAHRYPYHVAIHLPRETTRFIGIDFMEPIERFALPLQNDAVAIDTQDLYDVGYRANSLGNQLLVRGGYTSDKRPFPTTLTDAQRDDALQRVESWKAQLDTLSAEIGS
jgi:hypothetical protein